MHPHSSAENAPDPAAEVRPIDPLHEIDSKRTFLWVLVFMIVVFGGMALLAGAFMFVLEQEHKAKIYDRDTVEVNQLRTREAAELSKTQDNGDGTQRISIEEAMRRLAAK